MSLQNLFGRKLDSWTEGVVAALYLHAIEPKPGMFDSGRIEEICALWEELRALPSAWATELCVETLEHSRA